MNSNVKIGEIAWQDGKESDFRELRDAVRQGTAQKFPRRENSSSEFEDEDEEPPEDAPAGVKFLWAAQHDHLDKVEALLATDRSLIRYCDEDGYTALHRACYSNHPEMVRKLLKAGADINAETSEDSWKPLHSACRWNAAECVEILLSWGADVNALTQGNQTPLHLAAFCGNSRSTIQQLLMHPDLKSRSWNCQQDTPKDIAMRNGNCVELFELIEPEYREY